ncbi:MAG: DUF1653 domain-containing protein [Lachnospiraceae bacterium]|nr:DUF1653 domain-containing protein [Lachnospiraceae bacterium]
MSRIPKPYEIYKHFKGNLYQVLALAEHSETGEKLVVYQALYGEFKIYARPLDNFLAKVDKQKYPEAEQDFRFELRGGEQILVTAPASSEVTAQEEGAASSEVTAQEEGAASSEVTAQEEGTEPTEELHIDSMVLQFLEADSYEERLNILAGLKHRITDEMITTMAIASDVEVPEGSLEERFLGLRNCLITRDKYECSRLR